MTIKPGFVSTPMTSHLKQSPLFVKPDFIAKEIIRGIEQGLDVMYIPSYWRFIMMIIRALPEKIFMKLNI
jgi:short-subunit dehydrogenase